MIRKVMFVVCIAMSLLFSCITIQAPYLEYSEERESKAEYGQERTGLDGGEHEQEPLRETRTDHPDRKSSRPETQPETVVDVPQPKIIPFTGSIERSDPQRSGFYPGPGPKQSPKVKWTFSVGLNGLTVPSYFDGALYVGGNGLFVLDAKTGKVRWKKEFKEFVRSPTLVGGHIFFIATDRQDLSELHCVEAKTGKTIWKHSSSPTPERWTSPVVANGVVYASYRVFRKEEGGIYSFAKDSGQILWHKKLPLSNISMIALSDTFLYSSISFNEKSTLMAVDHAGKVGWQFKSEASQMTTPAFDGKRVYVGTGGSKQYPKGAMHALHAGTGKLLWTYPQGSFRGVAVANGTLFFVGGVGELYAVDTEKGTLLWNTTDLKGAYTSPSVADGVVYVGDYGGRFSAYDVKTGALKWRHTPTPNHKLVNAASIYEGMVFLMDYKGTLHAYQ